MPSYQSYRALIFWAMENMNNPNRKRMLSEVDRKKLNDCLLDMSFKIQDISAEINPVLDEKEESHQEAMASVLPLFR